MLNALFWFKINYENQSKTLVAIKRELEGLKKEKLIYNYYGFEVLGVWDMCFLLTQIDADIFYKLKHFKGIRDFVFNICINDAEIKVLDKYSLGAVSYITLVFPVDKKQKKLSLEELFSLIRDNSEGFDISVTPFLYLGSERVILFFKAIVIQT